MEHHKWRHLTGAFCCNLSQFSDLFRGNLRQTFKSVCILCSLGLIFLHQSGSSISDFLSICLINLLVAAIGTCSICCVLPACCFRNSRFRGRLRYGRFHHLRCFCRYRSCSRRFCWYRSCGCRFCRCRSCSRRCCAARIAYTVTWSSAK